MANDLVRKTTLLGSNKTIIGDGKSDIVLETLGKVYIKTGNNLKLLNELFKLLDKINLKPIEDIKKSVIITSALESLDYPGSGILVFDTSKNALYISYDNRYILILDGVDSSQEEYNDNSHKYVKRTGDSMSGPLTITYKGAPLIIASKELIKRLNAEYLNSYSSEEIAIKKRNEFIEGHWTFIENTIFSKDIYVKNNAIIDNDVLIKNNALVNKNLTVDRVIHSKDLVIIDNVIGTGNFAGGYGGYGWLLDSTTNMLTVDYLVVRKAMQVYELVVNEISATNGILWVTDTCTIEEVYPVKVLDNDELSRMRNYSSLESLRNKWYLPLIPDNYNSCNISGNHLANSKGVGENKTYYNYGFIINFNTFPEQVSYTIGDQTAFTYKMPDFTNPENSDMYDICLLFPKHSFKDSTSLTNKINNKIYDVNQTPRYFSTLKKGVFTYDLILSIYIYYKYFASESLYTSRLYVISLKDLKYPTLREGDIIRCLKFKNNSIKYYDALVVSHILNTNKFVILLAPSVFDNITSEGKEIINYAHYGRTRQFQEKLTLEETEEELKKLPEIVLTTVEPKDDLVRIGNIEDLTRQGSIMLSSSELNSPNIKVLSGINKPDFEVEYTYPKFAKVSKNNKEWYYKPAEGVIFGENFINIDGKSYQILEYPDLKCVIEKNDKGELLSEFSNHVKVLLGNLINIKDNNFIGKLPHGYGLYGLNVYLTGEFYLNNGQSVVDFTKDAITLAEGNINSLLDKVKVSVENILYTLTLDYTSLKNLALENINNIWNTLVSSNNKNYSEFLLNKKLIIQLEIDRINPIYIHIKSELNKNNISTQSVIDSPKYEQYKLTSTEIFNKISYENLLNNLYIDFINSLEIIRLAEDSKETPINNILTSNLKNSTIEICKRIYDICTLMLDDCVTKSKNLVNNFDTAGIYIEKIQGVDTVAIWGDRIALYTKSSELDKGTPTLLLLNGRINAELIDVSTLSFDKLVGKYPKEVNEDTPKVLTINSQGKGESILYYPSGFVMNCKIIKLSTVNGISTVGGCVEYFFADLAIKEDVVQKGELYIDNYFKDLELTIPGFSSKLIKKIDYFSNPINISCKNHLYVNNLAYGNPTDLTQWSKSINATDDGPVYTSFKELADKLEQIRNNALLEHSTHLDLYNKGLSMGAEPNERLCNKFIGSCCAVANALNNYYECESNGAIIHCIEGDINKKAFTRNVSDYLYNKYATDILLELVNSPDTGEDNEKRFLLIALPDGLYIEGAHEEKKTNSNSLDTHEYTVRSCAVLIVFENKPYKRIGLWSIDGHATNLFPTNPQTEGGGGGAETDPSIKPDLGGGGIK